MTKALPSKFLADVPQTGIYEAIDPIRYLANAKGNTSRSFTVLAPFDQFDGAVSVFQNDPLSLLAVHNVHHDLDFVDLQRGCKVCPPN